MNNADATKVKQQIVEKIKSSTNILVTVSRDPSVDDLSAAIGLSTLLNKIGKHSTAIFSGAIPPAISFLEPDSVFENTADSLRDFIIALDKEKADHLRYKVEGDVVKIFITPYRTTITSDDLDFSQGDFNVELVLALGVDNQDHLDTALSAHGGIMDSVTIATFTNGTQTSNLGSLDWHDDNASSLSEMVTSISEALKTDKPVLDKQIATSLLTGIVAATDRFSNDRTTSKVMTMAAQLMAAGADQQLIAAKLREAHEIQSIPEPPKPDSKKIVEEKEPEITPLEDVAGKLTIDHTPVEMPKPNVLPDEPPHQYDNITPAIQPVEDIDTSNIPQSPSIQPVITPEQELTEALNAQMPITPAVDIAAELEAAVAEPASVVEPTTQVVAESAAFNLDNLNASTLPDLSGIYNEIENPASISTTSTLPDEPVIEAHTYLGNPMGEGNMNSSTLKEDDSEVDIFNEPINGDSSTLAEAPEGLPLPPPLPTDFSTLPEPLPNMNVSGSVAAPIDNTASTLPPEYLNPAQAPTQSTVPVDPGQFRIPGQ